MPRLALVTLALACCARSPQAPSRPAPPPEPAPAAAAAAKTAAADEGKAAAPGEAAEDKLPDGENVLAQVLEMNGDKYGRPASSFRPGHVTRRKPPKVTRTKTGFEVQFASRAPIVTPAVHDGRVYVSGGFRSKEFYAFEATSGSPVWAVSLDDDGPSSAACAERVCVFNTESCTIFSVDATTGKMLWSWWLGDPLTSSPTIAGGRAFTSYPAAQAEGGKPRPPGASHALAAFDLRTGALQWQMWLDSDVMSAPVAAGEFLYVSTFAGTLIKVEQATGKVRYAIRARATSAPVVLFHNGRESMYYTRRGEAADEADGAHEMIIRADDNEPKTKYKAAGRKAEYLDSTVQSSSGYAAEGKANDAANGFGGGAPASANAKAAKMSVGQASVHTMQAFQGSRVLHMSDRNVNTMGDEVVATSAETGEKLWAYKLAGDVRREGGFLGTAPLAAGDSVIVATLAGEVIRIDPRTGKSRTRYPVGARVRSQPVVADGWIYVGTEDGRLVAIDTGDRSLTGWPMWGGNAARAGIYVASR